MIVFHLKTEWFNKIKAGEKTHEYRKTTGKNGYKFLNQFLGAEFDTVAKPIIRFDLGYPKITDRKRQLFARLIAVKIVDGTKTDLNINEPVWDVEFELIKEQ